LRSAMLRATDLHEQVIADALERERCAKSIAAEASGKSGQELRNRHIPYDLLPSYTFVTTSKKATISPFAQQSLSYSPSLCQGVGMDGMSAAEGIAEARRMLHFGAKPKTGSRPVSPAQSGRPHTAPLQGHNSGFRHIPTGLPPRPASAGPIQSPPRRELSDPTLAIAGSRPSPIKKRAVPGHHRVAMSTIYLVSDHHEAERANALMRNRRSSFGRRNSFSEGRRNSFSHSSSHGRRNSFSDGGPMARQNSGGSDESPGTRRNSTTSSWDKVRSLQRRKSFSDLAGDSLAKCFDKFNT